MFVEEINLKPTATKQQSRAQKKLGYVVLDHAARQRATTKHLIELEKDNHTDARFDIPKEVKKEQGKVDSASVRKILASRKTFANYLDESNSSAYLQAAAKPSRYPQQTFCGACGYWGKYKCQKCGASNCSIPCKLTHEEAGCSR